VAPLGRSSAVTAPRSLEAGGRSYAAYGLSIRSVIPLDEFTPASSLPDHVRVSYGDDPGWVSGFRHLDHAVEIYGSEARFWFREAGAFSVRDGSEIVAIPEPGVDPSLLRLYVEGMMMAMILHQRGYCVLHSSVAEIQGGGVALLGHIGAGKSSLAAALYLRGHRVASDDNAAVETAPRTPTVAPAYPYVKLFPGIASILGFEEKSIGCLHRSQSKVSGALNGGFARRHLPLRRIYVLRRDLATEVAPLSPLETTVELLKNSIPTRWGHAGDARQLQQCATLARKVPAFAIRTFTDLSSLHTVAEFLERHYLETRPPG
jgi:hypothetical protein